MSYEETGIGKHIATVYLSLYAVTHYMKLPAGMSDVALFASKNAERNLAEDSAWENVHVKSDGIDGLTDMTVQLLWACLSLATWVNFYRKSKRRAPVNFLQEATNYDKEQKASQQQGPDADQKGQD